MKRLIGILQDGAQWVDDRLYVSKVFAATAGHHVPKSSGSWFYVFGSATLMCFMIQVITGALLAMVYVPSADQAYNSLEVLNYNVTLGWFLRAVHNWGSLFMVAIMLLHMTQVFLFGAYKYPRELTWLSGVVLMALTLGMAFTGQVLRFDEDAYWGLGIGAAIAGRSPGMGEQVVNLLLGGPIIAAETLSRFFTTHVFILPGAILALVSLHLRLVLTKGINEYPKPGHIVRRETYDAEYAAILKKEGVPFFPDVINKDLVFNGLVLLAIIACALLFGPKGPIGDPNPLQINTHPRPDFFFMWIFAIAALMPPELETIGLLFGPVVVGLILFALPFFNGTGEKSFRRRPVSVLIAIFVWVSLCILTYMGITAPWSPKMHAWSADPTDRRFIEGRSPLELQGAIVLQEKQCRNCHAIDGVGGRRGPDLADVGSRLYYDQLVRQVIQGGGNMPAYGKNLSPAEVNAVVTYMVSLRSKGMEPSRDPTYPAVPPPEPTEKKETGSAPDKSAVHPAAAAALPAHPGLALK